MRRFIASILVGSLMSAAVVFAEEPVYFPDANLKAAVQYVLRKANPTPTDMLALTSLNADARGITNLTGLEQATNLEELYLRHNQISDLSPLCLLANLTYLECGHNEITAIPPLTGMTNLEVLVVRDNRINDLSSLAELTNLQVLSLEHNQISDLSPLAGLTNLRWLELGRNQISDLLPLTGLTNLTALWLFENQISDLSPLAGLTNLRTLHLDEENQISDLSPLAGLTNLQRLYLAENQISDLSPLAELTKLTALDLTDNPLNAEACDVYIPLIRANNPGSWIWHDACRKQTHSLTISISTGGGVSVPGEGVYDYDHGTQVQLRAEADPGHQFTNWSGSFWSTENPTWITMDQDHNITANFERLPDKPSPWIDSTSLTASMLSGGKASLIWSPVSDAMGYRLERREHSSQEWTEQAVLGAEATTYEDMDLAPDTRYYYRLKVIFDVAYTIYSYSREASVYSSFVSMPRILCIEPATPKALAQPQTVTIRGYNLHPEAIVNLYCMDGTSPDGYPYPNREITERDEMNGTYITINPAFGTVPADWAVEVVNPTGETAKHYFIVTVDGFDTLLDFIERDHGFPHPRSDVQLRQITYMLATIKVETGDFTPKPENPDLEHWHSAKDYFNWKYGMELDILDKVGQLRPKPTSKGELLCVGLGNTDLNDGYRYRGRGYVQLTGKYNYRKFSFDSSNPTLYNQNFSSRMNQLRAAFKDYLNTFLGNLGRPEEECLDLYQNPERALEPEIAYAITSYGMRNGMFTGGDGLSSYINGTETNYTDARNIVGPGSDPTECERIANEMEESVEMSLRGQSYVNNGSFAGGRVVDWGYSGSGLVNTIAHLGATYWAQLTTQSPITLYQTITTPVQPFELSFDYQFTTATGTLDVMLDSVVLATITAPEPLQAEPERLKLLVRDADLLGREDVVLAFWLDGPSGSQVLLTDVRIEVPPLLAHWTFDDGTGPVADDLAGGNLGAIHGAAWTDGVLDGALRFDGMDDYVDCGNAAVLAPEQITMAFWMFLEDRNSRQYILGKAGAGGNTKLDYKFTTTDSGRLVCCFGGESLAQVTVQSNQALPLGRWVHVAATRDGSTASLYINGQLESSVAHSLVVSAGDESLRIGAIGAPENWEGFFRGKIDDVRVYNRALTESDTLDLYPWEPPAEGEEDFENGFGMSDWTFDGPWEIVQAHSGGQCAKAGSIGDYGRTSMSVTVDCQAREIRFWWKVSSESSCDFLRFSIDGESQGEWSGELDWQEVVFPVQAGKRTFTWTYKKDGSVSRGQDTSWIDDITFPVP